MVRRCTYRAEPFGIRVVVPALLKTAGYWMEQGTKMAIVQTPMFLAVNSIEWVVLVLARCRCVKHSLWPVVFFHFYFFYVIVVVAVFLCLHAVLQFSMRSRTPSLNGSLYSPTSMSRKVGVFYFLLFFVFVFFYVIFFVNIIISSLVADLVFI